MVALHKLVDFFNMALLHVFDVFFLLEHVCFLPLTVDSVERFLHVMLGHLHYFLGPLAVHVIPKVVQRDPVVLIFFDSRILLVLGCRPHVLRQNSCRIGAFWDLFGVHVANICQNLYSELSKIN